MPSQSRVVKAPTGTKLTCKGWLQEAAYRMIQNNLDPSVAENPKDLYWSYNGFIMPSKFEGFGLTAYEAMASGIPLFLSDIPAFKSLIKNKATSLMLLYQKIKFSIKLTLFLFP